MILAIDVGKGTEDVILWDQMSPIENSIQLVLPSTAQMIKAKLIEILKYNSEVYFTGDTIAGEPWHKVVYDHCASNPNSIIMDEIAARSLRYNLDQVRSKGVKVVRELNDVPEDLTIVLEDIHWERLINILQNSGIATQEITALLLCCQDHGEPDDPLRSARDFRMDVIYQQLNKNGLLSDLLLKYDEVPSSLPRLKSISKTAKAKFPNADVYVMDSSPAVVLGAMDGGESEVIINVGNGHTIVMVIEEGEVKIVYEHHTGIIDKEKLRDHINGLLNGTLKHHTVLEDRGHGVYRRQPLRNKEFSFKIIGPNREKVSGLGDFIHPGGNMMMAGPLGLIKAYRQKIIHDEKFRL